MGQPLPVDLADSSTVDVVDFPSADVVASSLVDVVDSPSAEVVTSTPFRVIGSQELARHFAEGCYAHAWVVASNTKLSCSWRDLKDVYSRNPQELEKYKAVSGVVSMSFGRGWGDEFYFDVWCGHIESHLIGYQTVRGVDHRDQGIDAYLG
ncbi:hypothetical protein BGX26_007182, partial [Mortierella sp. AD094]